MTLAHKYIIVNERGEYYSDDNEVEDYTKNINKASMSTTKGAAIKAIKEGDSIYIKK